MWHEDVFVLANRDWQHFQGLGEAVEVSQWHALMEEAGGAETLVRFLFDVLLVSSEAMKGMTAWAIGNYIQNSPEFKSKFAGSESNVLASVLCGLISNPKCTSSTKSQVAVITAFLLSNSIGEFPRVITESMPYQRTLARSLFNLLTDGAEGNARCSSTRALTSLLTNISGFGLVLTTTVDVHLLVDAFCQLLSCEDANNSGKSNAAYALDIMVSSTSGFREAVAKSPADLQRLLMTSLCGLVAVGDDIDKCNAARAIATLLENIPEIGRVFGHADAVRLASHLCNLLAVGSENSKSQSVTAIAVLLSCVPNFSTVISESSDMCFSFGWNLRSLLSNGDETSKSFAIQCISRIVSEVPSVADAMVKLADASGFARDLCELLSGPTSSEETKFTTLGVIDVVVRRVPKFALFLGRTCNSSASLADSLCNVLSKGENCQKNWAVYILTELLDKSQEFRDSLVLLPLEFHVFVALSLNNLLSNTELAERCQAARALAILLSNVPKFKHALISKSQDIFTGLVLNLNQVIRGSAEWDQLMSNSVRVMASLVEHIPEISKCFSKMFAADNVLTDFLGNLSKILCTDNSSAKTWGISIVTYLVLNVPEFKKTFGTQGSSQSLVIASLCNIISAGKESDACNAAGVIATIVSELPECESSFITTASMHDVGVSLCKFIVESENEFRKSNCARAVAALVVHVPAFRRAFCSKESANLLLLRFCMLFAASDEKIQNIAAYLIADLASTGVAEIKTLFSRAEASIIAQLLNHLGTLLALGDIQGQSQAARALANLVENIPEFRAALSKPSHHHAIMATNLTNILSNNKNRSKFGGNTANDGNPASSSSNNSINTNTNVEHGSNTNSIASTSSGGVAPVPATATATTAVPPAVPSPVPTTTATTTAAAAVVVVVPPPPLPAMDLGGKIFAATALGSMVCHIAEFRQAMALLSHLHMDLVTSLCLLLTADSDNGKAQAAKTLGVFLLHLQIGDCLMQLSPEIFHKLAANLSHLLSSNQVSTFAKANAALIIGKIITLKPEFSEEIAAMDAQISVKLSHLLSITEDIAQIWVCVAIWQLMSNVKDFAAGLKRSNPEFKGLLESLIQKTTSKDFAQYIQKMQQMLYPPTGTNSNATAAAAAAAAAATAAATAASCSQNNITMSLAMSTAMSSAGLTSTAPSSSIPKTTIIPAVPGASSVSSSAMAPPPPPSLPPPPQQQQQQQQQQQLASSSSSSSYPTAPTSSQYINNNNLNSDYLIESMIFSHSMSSTPVSVASYSQHNDITTTFLYSPEKILSSTTPQNQDLQDSLLLFSSSSTASITPYSDVQDPNKRKPRVKNSERSQSQNKRVRGSK